MPAGASVPAGIPLWVEAMTAPLTRRVALTLIAAACTVPAQAADYAIDWQGEPPDPAVAARVARQVDMVRALPIRPAILAFFAAEVIRINRRPGEGSRAAGRVYLTRDPFPDDNPVLLHELIHRWHFDRLANTPRVPPLRDAFAAERAAPHWPAGAYLYRDIGEYLAMCASVVIHGRAARPPYTRDLVRDRLPATYAFIVDEFGVRF